MTDRLTLHGFAQLTVGHQAVGLWAHPEDHADRFTDLEHWVELARLLERGRFDTLFLADILGPYDVYGGDHATAARAAAQLPVGDPVVPISAMAAATTHLGFGITASTTYDQPYTLARTFSTLDHLTKGRVGWNIVTSYLDSAARNLGLDTQVPHDERYDRAEEFLQATYALWEGSWEDDAVVRDATGRTWADPDKVHGAGFAGRYYSVPGPHLLHPSPQRTPVLFQAGASSRGRAFAARHAEVVFVNGPTTAIVRGVVDKIRAAAADAGRDPRAVRVIGMLTPVVAPSDAEARRRLDELQGYADREGALALFGGWTGVDLSGYGPDDPLEYLETDANRSALASFTTADPTRRWTVGELADFVAIGGRAPVVTGSSVTVADEFERWAEEADLDGFNVAYTLMPGTFVDFVDHVVPELQARGRVQRDYAGGTLREALTGGGPRLAAPHPAATYRRPTRAAVAHEARA